MLGGALLRAAVYSLLVPGVICGGIPWAITRWGSPPLIEPPAWAVVLGWLAIGLGAAIYCCCAIDFVRRGQGTPNPLDPPRRLVVTGPYRVVRNPMYVGVLLLLLGQALRWPSSAMLGLLAGSLVFVLAMVLGYEEPALARTFGADYRRYRASTPRFIPRPWRRPAVGGSGPHDLEAGA